ncbi:MAG: hypothetical protein V8S87_09300 [Oscillospiraceae bacterium]
MTYGYVYVAQIAMGANKVQTPQGYRRGRGVSKGPSLIIGLLPPARCTASRAVWRNCQKEMEKAVKCGYCQIQSGRREALHSRQQGACRRLPGVPDERGALQPSDPRVPERATKLFAASEENAKERYEHLLKLKALYE